MNNSINLEYRSSIYPCSLANILNLANQFSVARQNIKELPLGDLITYVDGLEFNLPGGLSQGKPLCEELQWQILHLAYSQKELGQINVNPIFNFRSLSPAEFVVLYQILQTYDQQKAGEAVFQETLNTMQAYLQDKCLYNADRSTQFLQALLTAPKESDLTSLIQICKNCLPKESEERTSMINLPIEVLTPILHLVNSSKFITAGSAIKGVCQFWGSIITNFPLNSLLHTLHQGQFPRRLSVPFTAYAKNLQEKYKMERFLQGSNPHCWIESLMKNDLSPDQIDYLLNNLWLTPFSVQALKKIENQSVEIKEIVENLTAKNIEFYIPKDHLKRFLKEERFFFTKTFIPKTVILESLRLGMVKFKHISENCLTTDTCLAAIAQDEKNRTGLSEDEKTETMGLNAVEQEDSNFITEDKTTEEFYLTAVKQNGQIIHNIPEAKITEEMWLAAVTQNGWMLQHVPTDKITEEMYWAAVKQNGNALQFVPPEKRTEEMCWAAIRQASLALQYVPEDKVTDEMRLTAIRQVGAALQFVPEDERTDEMCWAAVTLDGTALQHVPKEKKTEELCLIAVTLDGTALQFVPTEKRTKALCLTAITQNGDALRCIPANERTDEMHIAAVTQNGKILYDIPKNKRTKAVCLAAVTQDGSTLKFLLEDEKTDEICWAAVKQDGYALLHVPPDKIKEEMYLVAVTTYGLALEKVPEDKITEEMCLAAVTQNGRALKFVPKAKRTKKIYLAAVTQDGFALELIPEDQRTKAICLAAVTQTRYAFKDVPDNKRTDSIYLAIINNINLTLSKPKSNLR